MKLNLGLEPQLNVSHKKYTGEIFQRNKMHIEGNIAIASVLTLDILLKLLQLRLESID